MIDDVHERPVVRTFKPRRRALRPARAAALAELGPRWLIEETGAVLDLDTVFGRSADVVLEIGSGAGDALAAMAAAQPHTDVIGCDVHTPGVAATLVGLDAARLDNVRVVHGDALVFLARLAPGSLAGLRAFFPDPWPKARQRQRRLVRADVVGRLVDCLVPGGWLHLATDIEDYSLQMQQVCDAHPELHGGPIARPDWRPVTRYEHKAIAAGRECTDLWYQRAYG